MAFRTVETAVPRIQWRWRSSTWFRDVFGINLSIAGFFLSTDVFDYCRQVRAGQCGCGFSDQDSDGDGACECPPFVEGCRCCCCRCCSCCSCCSCSVVMERVILPSVVAPWTDPLMVMGPSQELPIVWMHVPLIGLVSWRSAVVGAAVAVVRRRRWRRRTLWSSANT